VWLGPHQKPVDGKAQWSIADDDRNCLYTAEPIGRGSKSLFDSES
jgi:hypothetical protein